MAQYMEARDDMAAKAQSAPCSKLLRVQEVPRWMQRCYGFSNKDFAPGKLHFGKAGI